MFRDDVILRCVLGAVLLLLLLVPLVPWLSSIVSSSISFLVVAVVVVVCVCVCAFSFISLHFFDPPGVSREQQNINTHTHTHKQSRNSREGVVSGVQRTRAHLGEIHRERAPRLFLASVMTDARAVHLTVDPNECAPVDGSCVHSPYSLGWSPHNVLFVATGWALYLHVNSLVAADAVIRPVYRPGGDTSSQSCIAGAKWALNLVPDEAYPATCRLCVRTTRDLFVYRVLRYGIGRIRVSAGVCIAPKHLSTENMKPLQPPDKTGRKRARMDRPTHNDDDDGDGDGDGGDNDSASADTVMAAPANYTDGDRTPRAVWEGPRWCLISYEWFPQDLLVTVTFGGIYIISMDGDTDNETSPQYRVLPAPAYRFAGNPVASLRPSCATRVMGCDADDSQLVVASPYWLRVFTVSSTQVHLTHHVEVHALRSIPVTLCCMRDNVGGAALRVFISAPMCILHGTVAMPARGVKNDPVDSQLAKWTMTDSWGPDTDLGDEIAVSRFLTIPLHNFASLHADVRRTEAGRGSGWPTLVLGVCQRRLLGFVGRRCVELIRCTRTNGILARRNVALELTGVAIHPSCTLAVVGLHFGSRHYPMFQLLPVSVKSADGFLSRLIQFQEGFFSTEREQPRGRGTVDGAGGAPASDGTLIGLWNRQTSTSYFVWEGLLPKSDTCDALMQCHHSYYDQYQHQEQQQQQRVGEAAAVKAKAGGGLEKKGGVSEMAVPGVIRTLRRKYLGLRQEHGIELFLRFPEKSSVWRQTLLRILRRCSSDSATIELILANALQLVAAAVHYAGFTRRDMANCVALDAECGTRSLPFAAAMQFVRLCRAEYSKEGAWIHTSTFAEQLEMFIHCVSTRCSAQGQPEEKKWPHTQQPISAFPCSVCGGENRKLLTLSLSTAVDKPRFGQSSTHDCSKGMHFTVFSGSTFAPLSFLAQDEVVSRCHACGMYDYVTGPLCRVCDALVM